MFAYLAAEHRRDVSRGELADALWPGELPDAWAAALRGVVSDVRRAIASAGLDGEALERTGDGYRLRLPADVVVDLDEARDALAAARADATDAPAAAAEQAARAAQLAELPFLPRHEGGWVDGVRRELQEILVEGLELTARGRQRAGDGRAAAAAAARLVEAEPYSEAAHRLRIEVLAASGDRAGAKRALEECRGTFADELGTEPSAELQAAVRRALEATPEPVTAPAASPLAHLSVLVVDDHDFQRRTAVALLDRLGVGSLADARDGHDALDVLGRATPPDVIVCDIDMPGMDGVEFIRHVAERHLASAVIVASGLDRSVLQAVEAVGEGYGLQVLGVVEKPLTTRRLGELLSSYRRPPEAPATGAPSDAELRAALDDGRVGVRFAPIVDLHAGAPSGAIAVATHEGAAPILLTAEHSPELTAHLHDRVLATALPAFERLADAGAAIELWIAMPEDAPADADRLLSSAREHDAEPRRIVCTVPEHAVRRRSPGELEGLTRLRVKGFGVCLSEYDGRHLGHDGLAGLPLTAVALAPALVSGAGSDPARAAALEDTLDPVHALELPVVARGCDDADDYGLLAQLGCRYVEGTFISAPLGSDELVGWALDFVPPSIPKGAR